ncbi:galactokinase [Thermodesulfobacteriota bacterium]
MFKIIQGKNWGLKDVEYFIALINSLDDHPFKPAQSFLNPRKETAVSRAPGRLDVMGGIADYSGSLVLQLPIKESTIAAAQQASEKSIKIISLANSESGDDRYFEMRLEDFFNDDKPIDYKSAQQYFLKEKWAAYIAGVLLVLIREKNVYFGQGVNILICSDVPEGKGVSSSAALEVATMTAVCSIFGIEIDAIELALLCQKVENLVVGAPCGIMDQMTSALGKESNLMALLCQPAKLRPFVQIPEEISFWGIESEIQHSVSGSDYTSVRVGAFMGQRIISEIIKKEDYTEIQGNYLANIAPYEFEKYYANYLPQKMNGREFIQKYQKTFDTVTEIDPELDYNIYYPTAHPIYETHRINIFRELLNMIVTEETCMCLGEQMYLSHESYTSCGLNSSGTDRLVELTKDVGQGRGLYGAKITGGGSGGTVAVLGLKDAENVIEEIMQRYTDETGHRPYLFKGSSMGADEFGSVLLRNIKE